MFLLYNEHVKGYKGELMKGKSMKKSVALLCMGLVLGGSVITGCSLVTLNYDAYLNAVAARIEFKDGSKIEITRKELRTAYNTYGFSQNVQNGQTEEEAKTKALDYLVSKELSIRDAEKRAREVNADDAILTAKEKKYLWERTYAAMISNIESYINKQDSSSEEEDSTAQKRDVFEKKCDLVYNPETQKYSLQLPASELSDYESHKFWSEGDKDTETDEGKEAIFEAMLDYIRLSTENKDAYQKYLQEVRTSEKQLKLSTEAKSVFFREIDRVYGILYDSFMVSKYEDYICSNENNNVVISQMLDLYSSKVRNAYATYYGTDQTDAVKEKSGDIYYFNEGINWFYVTQILVKFDDAEQAKYNEYSSAIEKIKNGEETNGETVEDYEKKIDELYKNLEGIKRVEISKNVFKTQDGVKAGNVKTVFENIAREVNTKHTNLEKIEKFDDLIYVYNEDPGIMNTTYNYIVGVDYTKPTMKDEKVVPYTVYSNWVEEFNTAAIELYNHGNGQIGDIYGVTTDGMDYTLQYNEDGANYKGLIRTSYGVHIMMYAGEAKNLFNNIDKDFEAQESDIQVLYDTRLKASTSKTYFDAIYEECVPEKTSISQSIDLNRLKSETSNITYFPKSF